MIPYIAAGGYPRDYIAGLSEAYGVASGGIEWPI